jgi:hypothetical protein
MQNPWSFLPSSVRLWVALNETAFNAAVTVSLRTAILTASLWTRGSWPTSEALRMASEKQRAAVDSMIATLAIASRPGRADPIKIASTALRPYRLATRRNARRLSR